MKIAALIPTRGDRPEFLDFCLRQMDRQTKKPNFIEVVDDAPLSKEKDISYRYRVGVERCLGKGATHIFFIEDDDFYRADYISQMLIRWDQEQKPDLIGYARTIYYYLFDRKFCVLDHPGRASMFCTMATNKFNFKWPEDSSPAVDMCLWQAGANTKAISLKTNICVGIKHGVGLCGGGMHHSNALDGRIGQFGPTQFAAHDTDLSLLRGITGHDFNFYENIIKQKVNL